MNKSNIANGQMFLHFTPTYMDKPKVWVKVKSEIFGNHYGEDKEEVSLFVDNNAMVKVAINPNYKIGLTEKWSITDTYYSLMVAEGEFVPLDDLNEVEGITLELGWPDYVIDF
jgi:hypothetical protein